MKLSVLDLICPRCGYRLGSDAHQAPEWLTREGGQHFVCERTDEELDRPGVRDRRFGPRTDAALAAFNGGLIDYAPRLSVAQHGRLNRRVEDIIVIALEEGPPASPACDRPPAGWRCSRESGHDGPCAAWPVEGRWVGLNVPCPDCKALPGVGCTGKPHRVREDVARATLGAGEDPR